MNIIKTFLKIVIIILAVLILTRLLLLGLYLLKNEEKTGIHEQSEATREISINYEYTGELPDFSTNEEDIPDEKYFESVEEAIKNKIFSKGMEYLSNIDEMIVKLESDAYVSVFYKSVKNKKTECFTACKLKVKIFDGVKKYAYLFAYPIESKKNAWFMGDSISTVDSFLDMTDYKDSMSVKGADKRFIWGVHPFYNIYTLKIEGQEPTEIIPYEEFEKTRYFWYYEDLESDKPGYLLEYEMEILKNYKY